MKGHRDIQSAFLFEQPSIEAKLKSIVVAGFLAWFLSVSFFQTRVIYRGVHVLSLEKMTEYVEDADLCQFDP